MHKFLAALLILFSSCSATHYYVVRHAEKAENTMSGDVPLSTAGQERAAALVVQLGPKPIQKVYSTNYQRTRNTVKPVADLKGLTVDTYQPMDTTFMQGLRNVKGDVLIAGHSNTVDDIVNQIAGKRLIASDLSDSEYGDLFILERKGRKFRLTRSHFGK